MMIKIYNTKNKRNPNFMSAMFKERNLQYDILKEGISTVPNARTTTFSIENLTYLGQKIWSSLPKNVGDCSSLENCKREI